MSIYRAELPSVALDSHWRCAKATNSTTGQGKWSIVEGPSTASASVSFPVELPSGAVIARAWLSLPLVSSPIGGIRFFRANGEDVPSSGEIDISITASTTSVDVVLSFASWGTVYNDESNHYGRLVVDTPALCVDFVTTGSTPPVMDGETASSSKELRLPRLLDAQMHERTRLACTSLSLSLKLDPMSTATVNLPDGQPEIGVGDYMEIFSPYGSVGVFRADKVEKKYSTGGMAQRCEMRHGITSLADDVVEEGNAIQAPIPQVFSAIFAMQTSPMWVLGKCEVPDDLEMVLDRNFQSLWVAFRDLTADLPDGYAWQLDQTTLPWRANLIRMPEEHTCEFRMNRNVAGVTITTNRDNQCTRVYAFGAGEGEERIGLASLIGVPYLDADNIAEQGIKVKKIANEDIYDALTLKDVAQRYLDRHKVPEVSIQVNGVDIHKLTGLTLDQFHLGQVCRVPLPQYGVSVREKVVSISWRDVIGKPDAVVAELNSRLRSPGDEIAELMREATGSKLIGGTVNEETTENSYSGITQSSSLVHKFTITGYGNTLSVRSKYTPAGGCRLNVDGINDVPAQEAESGSVDILRYLKSDENGVPIVGEHYINYFARGTGSISVHSEITVKTIEKR